LRILTTVLLVVFVFSMLMMFQAAQRLSPRSGPASIPRTVIVVMTGSQVASHGLSFVPNLVVVGVNSTVLWVNGEELDVWHRVVSDEGLFDSGPLSRGDSFQYTFTRPGTYSYHSSPFPYMKGTVVVKAD